MSMNSPDYLTYKKSKQKLDKEERKRSRLKIMFWIFVISFALSFALFTNFAAKYTTRMDIEYDKSATTAQGQSYIGNAFGNDSLIGDREPDERKRVIDSRLKLIELEESAPYEARVKNQDQNAVIDKEHYDRIKTSERAFKDDEKPATHIIEQEIPTPSKENTFNTALVTPAFSPEIAPQTFSKVLAGRYKTFEDAKIAQTNIRNSGQVGTPFIRKIGDIYTLQVGSYANPEIAKNIAQNYADLGYDVWILQQ